MDSSQWDARYEQKDLIWSAEPNQFLPPAVEELEPGSCLDLAAGEGRNSIWLASQGWSCTAVDFSGVALAKGKMIAESKGLELQWVEHDVLTYDPEPIHDLVLIFYVHLLEDQMGRLFDVARKALKPGGKLICVGHSLRNLGEGVGGPQYPEVLWTTERLGPLLEGFDVMRLEECERAVLTEANHLHPAEEKTAIDVCVEAVKSAV